ncbi:MAG: hypothetical protein C0476_11090 [Sphingomonas sp.]|nr:hypothetical protein [Sphingomonas sp.]
MLLSLLGAVALLGAAPAPKNDWRPVVSGRLANGVRYAILPRRGSEPGVALLMRNEGGFIAEQRPGERGLAHLIEHLFFHSPTKAAPDDVHRFLRIGLPLTFSAPTAGTTTWRESNYFVSTKSAAPHGLDTLLRLFREVATDLTFRADTVAEQRADVMREMAWRKPGNDTYARYIAAVAPGSPTDVIDAQNSDDVPTASIGTIRRLYRRLYQPQNMMVVVVGPVDPVRTRALIAKRFGGWRGSARATPRTAYPSFDPVRITPISVAALPEGRRSTVMTVVMPNPPVPASRTAQADAAILDMLAMRAVGDRLAQGQAGKAGAFIEHGENGHRLIILWDDITDDRWAQSVTNLKRTTCDLRENGFTDAEWNAARRNVLDELKQRARSMASVPSVELAKDLSHALADGRALIPPDELLTRARLLLPATDRAAGSRWWRSQWTAAREHLRVEAPALATVADPIAAVRTTADDAVGTACKIRR